MKKSEADAIKALSDGLKKFKDIYKEKGWEEDELHQKITEAFEVFPMYKYNNSNKWTWKSILWHGFLATLLIYFLGAAVLKHNRRLNKTISDMYFDSQLNFQYVRLARLVALPMHRLSNLESLYKSECVIRNPLFEEEALDCSFCEGIDSIQTYPHDHPNISDFIQDQEPVHIPDTPQYVNISVTYTDLQQLVQDNHAEINQGACEIRDAKVYKDLSDHFQLSEEEFAAKRLSLWWKNCDSASTRHYRKYFLRPSYIQKSAEVYIEKWVYILNPNSSEDASVELPLKSTSTHSFIAQVSGTSTFVMKVPETCHYNCTETPIVKHLKRGELVNFPSANWQVRVGATGNELSILYLSSWEG